MSLLNKIFVNKNTDENKINYYINNTNANDIINKFEFEVCNINSLDFLEKGDCIIMSDFNKIIKLKEV